MKFKARSFFIFNKRDLRLSYVNWRERCRQGATLRYFIQQPKDDNRTAFGRVMDILGGLLLFWLMGFVLLANFTGKTGMALAISLPLLPMEALLLKKLLELRDRRRQYRRWLWSVGQKFMEEVLKMNPQKEFIPFVRKILAGLPGFGQVKKRSAKVKEGVDLESVFKGTPLAVRCVFQEGDKKTTHDDIQDFAGALIRGGYKNGLFITTGSFSEGVLTAVKKAARRGVRIKLANRYRLMDMARQAGLGAFQVSEPVPAAPVNAVKEKFAATLTTLVDSACGSRKKAKSYFLYGLLLYGGYALLKNQTLLSLVYLSFATLNFLMCAGCLYFGKTLDEI